MVGWKYVQNGRQKEYIEKSSSEAFPETCIWETEELKKVMMM
jgi:hypothetical protein